MPRKKDEVEIAFETLVEVFRREAERNGLTFAPKPKLERVDRVKAGHKGGKTGRVRAKALIAKRRTEIAKHAGEKHWKDQAK